MATKRAIPSILTSDATPPGTRSTARSVVVPTVDDLEFAKSDALLQLRIGRSAHYSSVVVSVLLLLDGALVLLLKPDISAIAPDTVSSLFFLIFPLFSGLFLSIFGLRVKWEVYQLWPWEMHFTMTVASVGLSLTLLAVYFLNLFQVTAVAHWNLLPWFYPLSLLSITLPLVALGYTWGDWTPQKTVSVASAVLPLPFALVLVLTPGGAAAIALSITLFAAAVLYQTSGSFLHLISSGTRAHEREVINSGQSRMFLLADEVRQKEEAVRFREATLLQREADAEDAEGSLLRQRQSLEEARGQFHELETDLQSRGDSLSRQQQEWALKVAETNTLQRRLEDKEGELALREQDLAGRVPRMTQREQEAVQREGELSRRGAELSQREQEIDRRRLSLPDAEARVEARRQEIEQRSAEVLRAEAELRSRESLSNTSESDRTTLQERLQGLEEREAKLNQLKMILDEQNLTLGRRAQQLDEGLRTLEDREGGLSRQSEGAAQREAAFKQRETEANDKLALATQRQQQYEAALSRYEERMRLVDRQEAEVGNRSSDLSRLGGALKTRENALKDREIRLEARQAAMDHAQRLQFSREKALEAREAESSLRAQEITQGVRPTSTLTGPTDDPSLNLGAGTLLDRPGPPARFADRLPTGLPRLDDLLSGGVPPRGHVLLVGPPFIGKEIVLYAFLAEGLKRGEPAIILTASRSPDEISPEIGLVSPQFREYEQMGRVLWIDASDPSGNTAAKATTTRMSVKGPEDHAAMLSALVQSAKKLDASGAKRVRVGFFGLANTLRQSEPRQAYNFLQNLVGILKPRDAIAMYAVDGGTLSDAQLESVQSRMDGAILFRQERSRTFLSVQGLGEVQTRDWVEYRATNRSILVGSFSLERIR